jgi:cytochrome c-type biogenesis protein CcmE
MQLASTIGRAVVLEIAAIATIVAAVASDAPAERPEPRLMFVDDLVNDLDAHEGNELHVHGWVAVDSIETFGEWWYRFDVIDRGKPLRVFCPGPRPGTLHAHAEVLATGRLVHDGGWYIRGTSVFAKWRSNFDDFQ